MLHPAYDQDHPLLFLQGRAAGVLEHGLAHDRVLGLLVPARLDEAGLAADQGPARDAVRDHEAQGDRVVPGRQGEGDAEGEEVSKFAGRRPVLVDGPGEGDGAVSVAGDLEGRGRPLGPGAQARVELVQEEGGLGEGRGQGVEVQVVEVEVLDHADGPRDGPLPAFQDLDGDAGRLGLL
jgi:hypothetical protein